MPESVPLLQPLLRGQRSARHAAAVRALANIDDPAAARAVHTVLRAATGAQRQAVVAALVAERDPRVVPVLVCILNESEPLGGDHQIVLETLGAIGEVGDDEAVPHVATVMRRRSWFARKKTRALKTGARSAPLQRIGSPAATQAIADAASNGDRLLRKLARAAADGAWPDHDRHPDLRRPGPPARRGDPRRLALFAGPPARPARRRRADGAVADRAQQSDETIVIGFIGDEVVVNARAAVPSRPRC